MTLYLITMMEQTTTYDKIVQWALNNPIISIIVIICTILIAIPQVREGVVFIIRMLWHRNNQKEFVIEYADEIITFEEKLISQNFDIIKINATTHMLGVRAEREWLNKNKFLLSLTTQWTGHNVIALSEKKLRN